MSSKQIEARAQVSTSPSPSEPAPHRESRVRFAFRPSRGWQ